MMLQRFDRQSEEFQNRTEGCGLRFFLRVPHLLQIPAIQWKWVTHFAARNQLLSREFWMPLVELKTQWAVPNSFVSPVLNH